MQRFTVLLIPIFAVFLTGCPETQPPEAPEAKVEAERIVTAAKAEADQILAEAEVIRLEVERARAYDEIGEVTEQVVVLNARIEATGKTELMLSRFTVTNPELFLSPENQPLIRFTVKNGTDYAISRAYFRAVFKAPLREVPYAEGDFNYRIPGGLEPGEEAEWTLENIPWISVADFPADRTDSIFEVSVVRVDDVHGDPVLDRTHAQADLEELTTLQARLAQLKDLVPGYVAPPPPSMPEPLPDPADTPSLAMREEVSGNVYTHENLFHVKRDCETMNGTVPGVTKADSARKRRLEPCPKCIG